MSKTTVIIKKITKGSYHLIGDREIEDTLLHEEYYSYERQFEDKKFDRFFIDIYGAEYESLYIAGVSPNNLLKIIEHTYPQMIDNDGLNFRIGVQYCGEIKVIFTFDGYTGIHKKDERTTIRKELLELVSNKHYSDLSFSIESKCIHYR